jgi:hypothetical protein
MLSSTVRRGYDPTSELIFHNGQSARSLAVAHWRRFG